MLLLNILLTTRFYRSSIDRCIPIETIDNRVLVLEIYSSGPASCPFDPSFPGGDSKGIP